MRIIIDSDVYTPVDDPNDPYQHDREETLILEVNDDDLVMETVDRERRYFPLKDLDRALRFLREAI